MSRGPGLGRTGAALAVAALTLAALGARLAARDWLLPHYPEPDRYLVAQVDYLAAGGRLREAPVDFWWYPSMVAEALALLPPVPTPDPDAVTVEQHWRAALAPILRVRTAVAWLAALAVPLTYLLARRFLRRGPALLAAALLATSLLHLTFSTQARLHAVQATAALLAVLGALRVAERGRWRDYVGAGLGAAAAVGVLQNGVFTLPALGAAHLLRPRAPGEARVLAPRALARLGLALALAALAFARFHPYLFVQQRDDQRRAYTELAVRDGSIELGPQRLDLERFDGSGFARLPQYLAWNDPVLLGLGAVGVLAWLASRRRAAPAREPGEPAGRGRALVVVLAYVVPLTLVMGSYRNTWGRFLLPLLPYLAVLAARGAVALHAAAARASSRDGRARPVLAGAGALAVLALPVAAGAKLVALRARPDTFEEAAAWVEAHLDPATDRVATTPGMFLPLFLDDASLDALAQQPFFRMANSFARETYWLTYQRELPAARRPDAWRVGLLRVPRRATPAEARDRVDAFRAELRPTCAVLERSQRMRSFQGLEHAVAALTAGGAPVAALRPHAPGDDVPWLDYQDQPWAFARILRQRALGPGVEILRLDP